MATWEPILTASRIQVALVSADTTRLGFWWFKKALANNKLFIRAGQFAGLDFYGDQQQGSSFIIEPLGYALGNLFTRGWVSDESLRDIAAHLGMSPGGFIGAPLCNGLTGRSRIPFSAGSLALPL